MKYYAIITPDKAEALGTGNSVYAAWENAVELGNASGNRRDESLIEAEITEASFEAIRKGDQTAIVTA